MKALDEYNEARKKPGGKRNPTRIKRADLQKGLKDARIKLTQYVDKHLHEVNAYIFLDNLANELEECRLKINDELADARQTVGNLQDELTQTQAQQQKHRQQLQARQHKKKEKKQKSGDYSRGGPNHQQPVGGINCSIMFPIMMLHICCFVVVCMHNVLTGPASPSEEAKDLTVSDGLLRLQYPNEVTLPEFALTQDWKGRGIPPNTSIPVLMKPGNDGIEYHVVPEVTAPLHQLKTYWL